MSAHASFEKPLLLFTDQFSGHVLDADCDHLCPIHGHALSKMFLLVRKQGRALTAEYRAGVVPAAVHESGPAAAELLPAAIHREAETEGSAGCHAGETESK